MKRRTHQFKLIGRYQNGGAGAVTQTLAAGDQVLLKIMKLAKGKEVLDSIEAAGNRTAGKRNRWMTKNHP